MDRFGGCSWTEQTWRMLLVSFRSGVPAEVSSLHLTVEVLQLVLHRKNGKLGERITAMFYAMSRSKLFRQANELFHVFHALRCGRKTSARTAPASTHARPWLPGSKPLQINCSFQLQITRAKIQKL